MNATTIPSGLLRSPSGTYPYNAGWLSPEGEFQYAEDGHEYHRSEVAKGYQHLDLGWVRITCTPHEEIGCQARSGRMVTEHQVAAILALTIAAEANYLFGDRDAIHKPSTEYDVRKALGALDSVSA